MEPEKRIKLLRKSICIFLTIQMFLTLPLWFGENVFSRYSLLSIDSHSLIADYFLFGLITGVIVVLFFIDQFYLYVSLLLLFAIAILLDLNRWQPYFHHYGLLLFTLGLIKIPQIKKHQVLTGLILLSSGVYIWSGIHKLNPWYETVMMTEVHRILAADSTVTIIIGQLITIIPYIELLTGILILFKPTRQIGVIVLILIHAGAILFLSPFGLGYNHVVWPWNVAAIIFAIIILYQNPISLFRKRNQGIPTIFATVAVWLFPLLNVVSSHFPYQSFNLYSGRVPHATLIVSDSAYECMPKAMKNTAFKTDRGHEIYLPYAAMNTSGIMLNPEPIIFKSWTDQYCHCAGGSYDVILELTFYNFTGRSLEYYYCDL